jgi:hypothetical protein
MARVEVQIDCSPGELRRLAGQPELLPLYEAVALRLERSLVRQVAAIGIPGDQAPAMSEPRGKPRHARPADPSEGDAPGAG